MKKTCSEVFHADITILVEVQSEVVVLDKDLHVLIGASHIGNELVLALTDHANEHADELGSLVVEKGHLFGELLELGDDLLGLAFDGLELFDVVNVWICQLISLAGLDVAKTFATFEKPEID